MYFFAFKCSSIAALEGSVLNTSSVIPVDKAEVPTPTISITSSEVDPQIGNDTTPEQCYADGALRAWSTVAGSSLLHFYTVGMVCI